MTRRELSGKTKLSIYQSIYAPTPVYAHELWVVVERMRLQTQVAEMSFLCRLSGLTLRDRARSCRHPEGARSRAAAPSRPEEPVGVGSGIWSGCLQGAFLWRFSWHVQLVGDPGVDPEHAGEIIYLIWLMNASGSPRGSCKMLQGERDVWTTLLNLLPPRPCQDKRQKMDGWNNIIPLMLWLLAN